MKERYEAFNNLNSLESSFYSIGAINFILFLIITLVGVLFLVLSVHKALSLFVYLTAKKFPLAEKQVNRFYKTGNLKSLYPVKTVERTLFSIIRTALAGIILFNPALVYMSLDLSGSLKELKTLHTHTLKLGYQANSESSLGFNDTLLPNLTEGDVKELSFQHEGTLYKDKRILLYIDPKADKKDLGLVPFNLEAQPKYVQDFASNENLSLYSVYGQTGRVTDQVLISDIDYLYVVTSIK